MEMMPPTDEGNEICSNQTNSHICKKEFGVIDEKKYRYRL